MRLHALPHSVVPLVATVDLPKQYSDLEIYQAALTQYESWAQQADAHYRGLETSGFKSSPAILRSTTRWPGQPSR